MQEITPDDILKYCTKNLDGVVLVSSWGERGIYYNPNNKLKRGVYVLTVKEKDGENDKSSNLDRQNRYRVNLGVPKDIFVEMFEHIPKRPSKGGIVDMDYDFTRTDEIMPHPIYAWMSWICVLNPSRNTFEELKPLILEAYTYAKKKYEKKQKKF
ncbi:MAG: hypothetical protein K2M46_10235 [Lachnospiraceae bacterium]|nr:hypothetical protein [Lachnospiraceae bacterium]